MPIVMTGLSEYEKELARWDTPRRLGGFRPDGYEPYPMMLSKAIKKDNGQWSVCEMPPPRHAYPPGQTGDVAWDQAVRYAEEWTKQCQLTVRNQDEYDRAIQAGWVLGQDAAIAKAKAWDKAIADAAAERNYRDRNISDRARAEVDRVEASTHEHVAEIPETPIKKRIGWPKGKPRGKKAQADVAV